MLILFVFNIFILFCVLSENVSLIKSYRFFKNVLPYRQESTHHLLTDLRFKRNTDHLGT